MQGRSGHCEDDGGVFREVYTRAAQAQYTSAQESGIAMTDDIQILLDLTSAAYRLAGRQMDSSSRLDDSSIEVSLREAFRRLGEAHAAASRALEASRKPTLGSRMTRR